MPRSNTPARSLTIGQLARRWSVAENRIRALVEAGHLTGAFRIPSAGRYGETVKIPLDIVLKAENDWAIIPPIATRNRSKRKSSPSAASFRHFPELIDDHELSAECREDGQH